MINEANITLSPTDLLYLFEFSRIYKVGGIASPYANIKWPRVQTPQALTAILQDKGINISLLNNDGEHQHAPIFFYERNPAGMGLDFNDFPEQKPDLSIPCLYRIYSSSTASTKSEA